ncbi:M14 family zinc carboxypeptidase [Lutibacter sp.]
MRTKLLFVTLFCALFFANAQTNKKLANKYLNKRGELAFTFTANNIDEVRKLSTIISFDHGQNLNNPLTIKAIANKKNFQEFLTFNLPFTIDKKINNPKDVVMFNPKIHKKGISGKNTAYTLAFPLTAYPTYQQYADQMAAFATDHPAIVELIDIGGTTEGATDGNKRLLFVKLSDNVSVREKEPRVMYTSSMHGDEIAGFPMMLSLIDYLITAYEDINHTDHVRVKDLLDNSEVWINPLANPDGTYYNDVTNTSVANAIRGNGNVIDLNRNYPEPEGALHPDGEVYQIETQNFMALAESTHFVLAANFHGGAEVVNYPWDFTYDRHPDDIWWQLVSKEYADNAQADALTHVSSDPNYFTDVTSTGYTHGADWYLIAGGRQDYMNFERHTKELTVELSSTKLIPANDIERFWDYNREALIDFLIQGKYGFHGTVKDAVFGNPIVAKITLIESSVIHDTRGSWVETELPLGDYYRPIKAGTYDILYEADCYQSYTLTNQTITDLQTIVLPDVSLTPVTATTPINFVTSSITNTTATIGWDDAGVSSYDIQYRVNGSSTWINTSSVTNSLDLTGLTASTTYEYQVRSVCNSSTSSYSTSTTFTTLAVNYCAAAGNSIVDEFISNVQLGGIDNNSLASTTSGYSDYTSSVIFPDLNLNSTNNTISVTKNWPGVAYNEAVAVWIDFNKDGTFDTAEMIFDDASSKTTTVVSPNFTVPGTAVLGTTRMRVIMKYYSGAGSNITDPCENTFSYGEVEDYTVNIVDTTLGIEDEILNTFQLYPNPVSLGEITIKMPNDIYDFTITISNMFGQKVYIEDVKKIINNRHTINTNGIKTGIYLVTVNTDKGKATKKLIIQQRN